MKNRFKLETKFILPVSILILIFLLLTTSLISKQYNKSTSLDKLKNGIILSTYISKALHETQIERGMSSGFITNQGRKFEKELLKQRAITNKRIKKLEQFSPTIQNKAIKIKLKKAILEFHKVKLIRDKIDTLSITATEIIQFYSTLNSKFLNIVVDISKLSKLPKITQNIIAYSNFLNAKENSGIERAVGTAILSQDRFKQEDKVHFTNLIAIQRLYLKNFLDYVSMNSKIFYNQTFTGFDIEEVERIRRVILYKKDQKQFGIDPHYWFQNMTSKINKLKRVDDYLAHEIISNIELELNSTYKFLALYAILNFISIGLFITMIVVVIILIKSEKRLKDLTDKYIISSMTDLKGNILDVSDAFCDISGYTKSELLGKPHNTIRHPDMPKSAFKDLWSTIKKGQTWQGKVKNLKKDGGYYWVYANIEPLLNTKGEIEAYAAVRLDITDSIHLQEELQRSKLQDKTMLHQSKLAQMGEMIAMIAHQWRQPLSAISANSSDLFLKIVLDNYDKDYFSQKLEKIDDLSQHLSKTIDDFRDFYKEDKEKTEMLFSTMVEGALDIVSTSIKNQNIEIRTDFKSEHKIDTYPNEMRQVILNLIKNAEDILLEKKITNPYIAIQTYDEGIYSYLNVNDNAGGVSENIMDKIFDPYFSTKTKKDGTGLGLHMSKTIIQEHCNGKLLVSNNANGALFTIKILNTKGTTND